MVFQDYALFPNRTVQQNVEYGIPRAQRRQLAGQWLERLHLTRVAALYPHQLSGGQRQRVALARALAHAPDILLLDEPFSAVDSSLRRHLRQELRETVVEVGRPIMLVTHDLEDVRELADTAGVMHEGELSDFGELNHMLVNPANRRSAEALGWLNFLPVISMKQQQVAGPWGSIELSTEPSINTAWLAIRPEHVRIAITADAGLPAVVQRVINMGAIHMIECRLTDGTLISLHRPWEEVVPAVGVAVMLQFPRQYLKALPEQGHISAPSAGDRRVSDSDDLEPDRCRTA
jgi:molybdate transport system ATP-binding protein